MFNISASWMSRPILIINQWILCTLISIFPIILWVASPKDVCIKDFCLHFNKRLWKSDEKRLKCSLQKFSAYLDDTALFIEARSRRMKIGSTKGVQSQFWRFLPVMEYLSSGSIRVHIRSFFTSLYRCEDSIGYLIKTRTWAKSHCMLLEVTPFTESQSVFMSERKEK